MSEFTSTDRKEVDPALLADIIPDFFREYREKQLRLAGAIASTTKDDGSDATALDLEIEAALIQHLGTLAPGLVVVGEETGYTPDSLTSYGLIDPIDGTTSFINGIPTWTNMFTYIHNREAVYSAIYNPSSDTIFHAVKHGGAYKNGDQLNLMSIPPPNIILCKEELAEPLREILGDTFDYQTPPSGGGHGLTMVAEGLIAARFQLRGRGLAHDYAPGGLLVSEAGGYNIPIRDDAYSYDCTSFVACHPAIKDLISRNIERIRPLERP